MSFEHTDPDVRGARKALSFAQRFGAPLRYGSAPDRMCPCCALQTLTSSGCYICDYLVNELGRPK